MHEFGHFTVAKLCKMKVKEFAIGMGPKLFKKRIGETVFAFKALPIGGSVMLDEDVENDDPRSFRNRPVWMRILMFKQRFDQCRCGISGGCDKLVCASGKR